MERRNAQFAGVRVRVDAWIADEDGETENQDARPREDSTRGNEVRSLERCKFVWWIRKHIPRDSASGHGRGGGSRKRRVLGTSS